MLVDPSPFRSRANDKSGPLRVPVRISGTQLMRTVYLFIYLFIYLSIYLSMGLKYVGVSGPEYRPKSGNKNRKQIT
jgi:hypothetical protein